jgi:hypothetical protein
MLRPFKSSLNNESISYMHKKMVLYPLFFLFSFILDFNNIIVMNSFMQKNYKIISMHQFWNHKNYKPKHWLKKIGLVTSETLLHIVPFCEGPNEKPKGFAKQKQSAIFAMWHASQLVMYHPSLIYNVPLIIAALLRHIRQTKLCDLLSLRPP